MSVKIFRIKRQLSAQGWLSVPEKLLELTLREVGDTKELTLILQYNTTTSSGSRTILGNPMNDDQKAVEQWIIAGITEALTQWNSRANRISLFETLQALR